LVTDDVGIQELGVAVGAVAVAPAVATVAGGKGRSSRHGQKGYYREDRKDTLHALSSFLEKADVDAYVGVIAAALRLVTDEVDIRALGVAVSAVAVTAIVAAVAGNRSERRCSACHEHRHQQERRPQEQLDPHHLRIAPFPGFPFLLHLLLPEVLARSPSFRSLPFAVSCASTTQHSFYLNNQNNLFWKTFLNKVEKEVDEVRAIVN